jgi:chemotaxis protein MotA
MNYSSASGILLALAIVWFGVIHPAAKPLMFLDQHALILVIGGTLSAALIAFPLRQLWSLFDLFFLAALFPKQKNLLTIASDIIVGARLARSQNILALRFNPSHGFLREAYKLAISSQLSTDELGKVLRKRASAYKKRYVMDAKALNALAKFPPAFGLLGASTGMIEMMSNLGKGGGTASIGSAMAIALVATFWGIAVANLILLPLADHANKLATDDQALRDMIIEGVLQIHGGASDEMLIETLRSYLPLSERPKLHSPVPLRNADLSKAG